MQSKKNKKLFTYSELRQIIHDTHKQLPSNQKKLAEYFLEYINDIPFMSIQEVSAKSSSSVASIVRLSKKIGFKGYADLREKIAESLQDQINNKEFFSLIDSSNILDDTLKIVAETDIRNINETLAVMNRESFNDTLTSILSADRVYTAGLGISFLLAEILSYQLNQVAVNSASFRRDSLLFYEQAMFLGEHDLLIIFSFPPYSQETIDLAKFCHEKKIKVISITNKSSAPASFYSSSTLVVKSKNLLYTNSFAAISVLINAIATEVAVRNKSKVKSFYEQVEANT